MDGRKNSSFMKSDGGTLLTERLAEEFLHETERDTHLRRLYDHWIDCGELVENDLGSFLLPHFERFNTDDVLNANERRFVRRLSARDTLDTIAEAEREIFGRSMPIEGWTLTAVLSCVANRDMLYDRIEICAGRLTQTLYRLVLPTVDSTDSVVYVDVACRFYGDLQMLK